MHGPVLTAVVAVVAASGLVVTLIEALRTVPWDGHLWRWFVEVKSRDPEWSLLLAGLSLIIIAGVAGDTSAWALLAAPVVYAWVVHHLRTKAPRHNRRPQLPPV